MQQTSIPDYHKHGTVSASTTGSEMAVPQAMSPPQQDTSSGSFTLRESDPKQQRVDETPPLPVCEMGQSAAFADSDETPQMTCKAAAGSSVGDSSMDSEAVPVLSPKSTSNIERVSHAEETPVINPCHSGTSIRSRASKGSSTQELLELQVQLEQARIAELQAKIELAKARSEKSSTASQGETPGLSFELRAVSSTHATNAEGDF